MCDCFKTVLGKVTENLKQKLGVLDLETNWKDEIFSLDGGCGIGLYIESEYTKFKKDGTARFNKTKNEHFIALTYCPFCGKKLEKTNIYQG